MTLRRYSHIGLDIYANQSNRHADLPLPLRSSPCQPLRPYPPSSLAPTLAGKAPSTPSSLKNSAAQAPIALQTPTTAFCVTSSAVLQKSPDQVSPQDVFSFAHGVGLSGREPSPTTVACARLSCISSFFKFLIRMDVLNANPCDRVDRPKPRPSSPSGLSAIQVQQLLQVIPDSVKGRRDLAIVLTLVLTGRRPVGGHQSDCRRHRPSTSPPRSTATPARAACAAAVNYPVRPWPPSSAPLPTSARTSRPCSPLESLWQAGAARSFRRIQRHLLQPLPGTYLRKAGLPLGPVSTSSATPPPSSAVMSASP